VIEHIEGPANPEILLDILHRCTKPTRCGKKNIEAVTLRGCDEFFEAIVH